MSEVVCPECGHEFDVTDAITDAINADLEEKYEKKHKKEALKLKADFEKAQELIEKDKKLIAKKMEEIDKTILERLTLEKANQEKKIRANIVEQNKVQFEDLKNQIEQKDRLVKESQDNEIELLKKNRLAEERSKAIELEFQRKLDVEKNIIEENVLKKVSDDQRLKLAEKDKQIDGFKNKLEEMQRKIEQGSQQTQGEVLEIEIEAALKSLFPFDEIIPVSKGVRGGDIVQKVKTKQGQDAGVIIWETKRTKTWSDSWLDKTKEDQRTISAEFAVIVTQNLPKGVSNLAEIDGVWVSDFASYAGLGVALRSHVLQLNIARTASVGKEEKLDYLYGYLTGTQFKQRVEAIVDSFRTMQDELNREKTATLKIWASRQKQIERVLTSTVGMYGDIQGIIGTSLPRIASIELDYTSGDGE